MQVQSRKTYVIEKLNVIIGGAIAIVSLTYFIPITVKILITGGGAFGYGLLAIPFCLAAIFFGFFSAFKIIRKQTASIIVLLVNMTGLIYYLSWLWLMFNI